VDEGTQAERRYEDLIDELAGTAGVMPPQGGSGFGRNAVRFQKKIFVMLVRGRLVLKLPADRVDALIAAGEGARFDPTHHEAVAHVESAEHEPHSVMEEHQAGYRLNDRLLRPALVTVAKAPPGGSEPEPGGDPNLVRDKGRG